MGITVNSPQLSRGGGEGQKSSHVFRAGRAAKALQNFPPSSLPFSALPMHHRLAQPRVKRPFCRRRARICPCWWVGSVCSVVRIEEDDGRVWNKKGERRRVQDLPRHGVDSQTHGQRLLDPPRRSISWANSAICSSSCASVASASQSIVYGSLGPAASSVLPPKSGGGGGGVPESLLVSSILGGDGSTANDVSLGASISRKTDFRVHFAVRTHRGGHVHANGSSYGLDAAEQAACSARR